MAYNIDISAIFLGNFTDTDTYEGNHTVENAADLFGTYGTETDPLWTHRVTLDSDSPTNLIETDQSTGDGTLSYDAGSGSVSVGLDSLVEYSAVVTFEDGSTANVGIDIIQMLNGDVFMIPYDSNTMLDDKPIESLQLTGINDATWDAFQQTSFDTLAFVCFTPGTRISVPGGHRSVEELALGDEVLTRDHGPQPLVWAGRRRLSFPGAPEGQKPVAFRPDSLGPGVPQRPLVLSPQHRVLIEAPELTAGGGSGQALAAAAALTGLPGVRRMSGKRQVDYVALMFARHEVIEAEGAPVESFYPGPVGLATLSPFELLSLRAAVPGIGRVKIAPARPLLSPRQSRALAAIGAACAPAPVAPL